MTNDPEDYGAPTHNPLFLRTRNPQSIALRTTDVRDLLQIGELGGGRYNVETTYGSATVVGL